MPTEKKRINLTVDDRTYRALQRLSAKRTESVSSVSLSLIEQALELQEDFYFARIADERLEGKDKRVSHDEVWD